MGFGRIVLDGYKLISIIRMQKVYKYCLLLVAISVAQLVGHWSHLENDRNVSAYSRGKMLNIARVTCVLSYTFKNEFRD